MNLEQAYNFISQCKEMDGRQVLYVGQTGSRYTGMSIETSDYDFFVICMPRALDLYKGSIVSFRVETLEDEVKAEYTVVDIRKYIAYVKSANLDALNVIYAKESNYYMPSIPLDEAHGIARDCQSLILFTQSNKNAVRDMNPYLFFQGVYGRFRTEFKNMNKSMEAGDYDKVLKHGYRIDYLVELLHCVYNHSKLSKYMTLEKMARDAVQRERVRAMQDREYAKEKATALLTIAEGEFNYFVEHPDFEQKFKEYAEKYEADYSSYFSMLEDTLMYSMFESYL